MKIIKKILIFIILIILFVSVFFISSGYTMYKNALNEMPLDKKISIIKNKKHYTKLEEMPQSYLDAVIAVEDHRFYKHRGIDIISTGRAVLKDIKKLELAEGGSTITQQLAKNMYFSQKKKFTRKIAEIFMAKTLEKNCEKNEILELYLNTTYFGDVYYTVSEASQGYFKKDPIQMSLQESTLLAGIPNAPSIYSPTSNPELSKKRQKVVVSKMVKYGYISQQEADEILEIDIVEQVNTNK